MKWNSRYLKSRFPTKNPGDYPIFLQNRVQQVWNYQKLYMPGRFWPNRRSVDPSFPLFKSSTDLVIRGSLHPPLKISTKSAVRGSLRLLKNLDQTDGPWILHPTLKIPTESAVRGSLLPLFNSSTNLAVRVSPFTIRTYSTVYSSLQLILERFHLGRENDS